MAVLSGRLELSIAGRDAQRLSSHTPAVSFSGEVPVYAEPRQEPVTDLNVMTRRGRFVARLTRRGAQGSTEVRLAADTTLLLALAPLTLQAPGISASLAALDAVQFSDSAQILAVQPAAASADFWLIEIDGCRPLRVTT
jgi:environmental stress-induced protein Ves